MADTIRGGGLLRADRALAALVEDPQHLDRARARFSESPPSYRSHLSHNSTRSQSPDPPGEEQRRREERKWQLIREHRASFPSNQFDAEKSEELDRLYEANRNRTRRRPAGTDIYKLAEENVKGRWVEQGIWNEKWKKATLWRWKHEEPLEPESESETEAADDAPLFCLSSERAEAKLRRPKKELRCTAEQRLVREREREASRPFHQFVYQVSKERERIQDEANPPGPPDFSDLNVTRYGPNHHHAALQAWSGGRTRNGTDVQRAPTPAPLDINSTAYERVKNTWMKRGIWNRKWGVLPGMSWNHEQPLEEMLREALGDDAPVQASVLGALPAESNEASGMNAPQQELVGTISGALESDGHGPPRRNLFRSPTAESSRGSVSGSLNASPQQQPPAVDATESLNGDISHSSAASSSRRRRAAGGEGPRSASRHIWRWGGREPSIGDGYGTREALGPVHATKVSKTRGNGGPGPRRRNAAELSSEAQQSLPGPDMPESPPGTVLVPPRRSRRLQEAERKMAPGPDGSGSHPRPKRISAGPKPQGVSKRRPRTRPR